MEEERWEQYLQEVADAFTEGRREAERISEENR